MLAQTTVLIFNEVKRAGMVNSRRYTQFNPISDCWTFFLKARHGEAFVAQLARRV